MTMWLLLTKDTKDLETKTCTLADIRPVITTTNNNTFISRVKVGLSQLQVLRCKPCTYGAKTRP